MMRHHLHMPSYFLGTFTEYPYVAELGRKLGYKTVNTTHND